MRMNILFVTFFRSFRLKTNEVFSGINVIQTRVSALNPIIHFVFVVVFFMPSVNDPAIIIPALVMAEKRSTA